MGAALVTGANGFIGSNLARHLLGRGWDVLGLVLKGTPEDFLDGTAVKIVYGDILQPASLASALKEAKAKATKLDAVFHLAALAADWGPAQKFFSLNAQGTRNMLEASAAAGVRRFVLMSSLAVHRYSGHSRSDETAPLDCPEDFPYGRSKIMAEKAVHEFHDAGRLEGVIIRPGLFPFGPNDTTSFARLARVMERGMMAYVGGGSARLTTAYVENLCGGVELAAREKRAAGQTYVIADDTPVSWRELFELFCRELGIRPPWLSVPYPVARISAAAAEQLWTRLKLKGEPPLTRYRAQLMAGDLVFVSDKARRELGYKPAVPLDEAVRRTVAWYKTSFGPAGGRALHPD